jgi:hypothetical protein
MTFTNLIAGIIFGAIGTFALLVGKKQANVKVMLIGLVLILYPYFVYNTIVIYLLGIVLTIAIFIFRD